MQKRYEQVQIVQHHTSISTYSTVASSLLGALLLQSYKDRLLYEKQQSGFARLLLSKCLCGQKCDGTDYSARSCLFTSSLSVYLDPRSLLGLTTLVAAFLNSSNHDPYAWYCSQSPGPELGKPHFLTVTSGYQTRKNAGNTGLALTASVVR